MDMDPHDISSPTQVLVASYSLQYYVQTFLYLLQIFYWRSIKLLIQYYEIMIIKNNIFN